MYDNMNRITFDFKKNQLNQMEQNFMYALLRQKNFEIRCIRFCKFDTLNNEVVKNMKKFTYCFANIQIIIIFTKNLHEKYSSEE